MSECSITKHNIQYIKFYDGDQTKEQLPVNISQLVLPIKNCGILIEMFTGKTPNFNETGWSGEGLPKIYHCGLQKSEFGVYNDVASFNYGKKGYFCRLKLRLGVYMKIVWKGKHKTKVALTI